MKRLIIALLLLTALLMGLSSHYAFADGSDTRDGGIREIRPNIPQSGTWS